MYNLELNNTLSNNDEGLTSIDRHFAGFICEVANIKEPWLFLAAAFASNAVQKGHVCVDLSSQHTEFSIDEWIKHLKKTSVVGVPGEYKPLILEDNRLYLHKYWRFEQSLSEMLLQKAKFIYTPEDLRHIRDLLQRLFGEFSLAPIDRQDYSALVALIKNMTIISGGPGTGKTTTVAKIVAFLMEARGIWLDQIALAAPTGKAAARLKQSFVKAFCALNVSPDLKKSAETSFTSYTIHRLLGVVPYSPFFKHNPENPLPHEVIVIDEASMMDFALMAKLLSALKPDSKIILLGDKDQLASVEAGAFFGDICEESSLRAPRKEFENALMTIAPGLPQVLETGKPGASAPSSLSECVVELTKNYRFPEHSGIGRLSRAIRQGTAADAMMILSGTRGQDVSWQDIPHPNMLTKALTPVVTENYGRFLKEKDPLKAFELFDSFRVLCALRMGQYGILSINSRIEHILASSGLIAPDSVWYSGKPVMITGNDYSLDLFNGDIGITMYDGAGNGELKVFFPGETTGAMKSFLPHRLPAHETVFAMTVHKAQGSEFDHILLILPPLFVPLLSRELLYTGITRAQKACEIWASNEILTKTIENRTKRTSGLREKLRGN